MLEWAKKFLSYFLLITIYSFVVFRSVTFRLFKHFWSMRKHQGNKLTKKKLLFSLVSLSPQI